MRSIISEGIKVFVSSSIDEFRTERLRIGEYVNDSQSCPPYEVWIYEYAAPEAVAPEHLYMRELRSSRLVLLILGEDIRPAVQKEISVAQANRIPIYTIVYKTGHSEAVKQFLENTHYRYWNSIPEMLEIVRATLINHTVTLQRSAEQFTPFQAPQENLLLDAVPPEFEMIAKYISELCDGGRYSQAIEELSRNVAGSEGTAKAEYTNLIAFVHRRQGNYDEALKLYARLEIDHGPRFRIGRALTHIAQDNIEEALVALEAKFRGKSLSTALLIRAQISHLQKRPAEALKSLLHARTARRNGGVNADFWMLFGGILNSLNRPRLAWRAFKHAARLRPTASPVALAYCAHSITKIPDDALLPEGLAAICEAESNLLPSMLAAPDIHREFLLFVTNVHASILHRMNKVLEALCYLESVQSNGLTSALLHYNELMFRMILYNEVPDLESVHSAALETGDETIWFNYVSRLAVKSINEGHLDSSLKVAAAEFSDKFPHSAGTGFLQGCLALFSGSPDEGVELLRNTYRNASARIAVRLNATITCHTACWNFDLNVRPDEILDEAEGLGLLSVDILATAMEAATHNRGQMHYSVFASVLHIARKLPGAIVAERFREAAIQQAVFQKLGATIGQAAKGVSSSKRAELFQVLDEVMALLSAQQQQLILTAMSEHFTL